MDIELRQLRYFVALAETLHFGRAAERLHMSQPPLSRQIAALERALGAQLFARHTRHTELTRAGQRFLEDTRAALLMVDQACANAARAQAGELGELKVGFMMHSALTVVPKLTRKLLTAHPGVKLHLREAIPSALPDDLLSGRFDAGILFPPGTIKGLRFRTIHTERLCLAVPSGHPLLQRRRITPSALREELIIAAPEDVSPTLRRAVTQWFESAGFAPNILLETQLQQTIVSLVAEQLGVALVPEAMRKLGLAGVEFLALVKAPEIEHVLGWSTANRNPALPRFLATCGIPEHDTAATI